MCETTIDNNSLEPFTVSPLSGSALAMMSDPNTSTASIELNSLTAPPTMVASIEAIVQGLPTASSTMTRRVEVIAIRSTAPVPGRITKYTSEQDGTVVREVAASRAHIAMHGQMQTRFKVAAHVTFQCPPICTETQVPPTKHNGLELMKQSIDSD